MTSLDWAFKKWQNEKLRIGDIVEVTESGAHLPMVKRLAKLTKAHWVSGIIAPHEYRNKKFEILHVFDNDSGRDATYHIRIENALEKKLAGWQRTEFFFHGRGLYKVKGCDFLGEELFEI